MRFSIYHIMHTTKKTYLRKDLGYFDLLALNATLPVKMHLQGDVLFRAMAEARACNFKMDLGGDERRGHQLLA